MSNQLKLDEFRNELLVSISKGLFVKVSLGNYHGNTKELKQIHGRKVLIKRTNMLSFTYRYKTKDIFKNFPIGDGIALIVNLMSNDFRICTLFTTEIELIMEQNQNGVLVVRKRVLEMASPLSLDHDKQKNRIIKSVGKHYLTELRITDVNGNVFKNAQDKYRQINQYIEILSALIKTLPTGSVKRVVDMGSGKGYLTFALYDYLHHVLRLDAYVTGVEYREDLVDLCNTIAKGSSFNRLNFAQGTIENYQLEEMDMLVALHACDTATDDAIAKGIKLNAKLIVVAPCCHKQIRREIESSKVSNDVSFLTKHGIFMERQAEMVTDGLRSLILEYFGYKTKVFEFISDMHTPKNVLIVGTKTVISGERRVAILKQIDEVKQYFGITSHHLEKATLLSV